ncbi:unnamed protein product [Closterium sp. Naga37s-1]|nr:unnamed protein product [Closterium sp. Naga37s-1]
MTAASNTSPRALRVARRGEASQPHERPQEELGGREGIVVPVEVAGEPAASAGGVAAAVVAVGSGAAGAGRAAAVAEDLVVTGPKEGAVEATAVEAVVSPDPVDGLDAAFGGDSALPSASPRGGPQRTAEAELATDQEQTEEEATLAASPEPVTAAELAAAVTTAAGERAEGRAEEVALAAATTARTSAAAEGASTRAHGQGGSDIRDPGPGASVCAARGKAGKKLRAQPAPRRPGAGLAPGRPGPLLGWLLQAPPRQGQEHRPPSAPQPATQGNGGETAEAGQTRHNTPARAGTAMGEAPQLRQDTQPATRRETRSVTRAQGITWGQPRSAPHVPSAGPWIPAGRAPQAAQGGGGPAGRGARGGGRGARGGRGRGGAIVGAIVGGRVALVRSGTWRERHDLPEQVVRPTNRDDGVSETSGDGDDYVASASVASEEVSLGEDEDEQATARGRRERGEPRRNPQEGVREEGVANGEQGESGVRSLRDLAEETALWLEAATLPRCMGDSPVPPKADPATKTGTSRGKPLDGY